MADLVAGIDGGTDECGVGRGVFTDHEEGGAGVMGGEESEDARGVDGIGAVVERQPHLARGGGETAVDAEEALGVGNEKVVGEDEIGDEPEQQRGAGRGAANEERGDFAGEGCVSLDGGGDLGTADTYAANLSSRTASFNTGLNEGIDSDNGSLNAVGSIAGVATLRRIANFPVRGNANFDPAFDKEYKFPEIPRPPRPGDDLLIDDGRIRVRVTGLGADFIDAKVITGGTISNRKGVNVPSAVLNLSPLTVKDRADLAFGLDLGVDWVALSFVQKPGDVIEAQGLVRGRAGIMAKIEKPAALEHIDDIIRLS
eukprot:gene6825-9212_t